MPREDPVSGKQGYRLFTGVLFLVCLGVLAARHIAQWQRERAERAVLNSLNARINWVNTDLCDHVSSLELIVTNPAEQRSLRALAALPRLERLTLTVPADGHCLGQLFEQLAGSPVRELLISIARDNLARIDAESLSHLAELPHLDSLYLPRVVIDGDGFAALGRLHGLRVLTVTCPGVTDDALRHFRRLDRLEYLVLRQSRSITGTGLQWLPSPERLHTLGVNRVTDAGLQTICRFTNLEDLSIGGEQITAEGFAQLARLPQLRKLSISHARLDNSLLAQCIGPLKQLRELSIYDCPITGDALLGIVHLRNLEELSIDCRGVNDESVPALIGFTGLRSLDIEGTSITDRSLPVLCSLKGLQELSVPFPVIDIPQRRQLLETALPKLYSLSDPRSYVFVEGRSLLGEPLGIGLPWWCFFGFAILLLVIVVYSYRRMWREEKLAVQMYGPVGAARRVTDLAPLSERIDYAQAAAWGRLLSALGICLVVANLLVDYIGYLHDHRLHNLQMGLQWLAVMVMLVAASVWPPDRRKPLVTDRDLGTPPAAP